MQSSPLKILVAQADAAVTYSELEQLARLGHRLDQVESVEAAVAALDREAYDLVLMDLEAGNPGSDAVARLNDSAQRRPNGPRVIPIGASATAEATLDWRKLVGELPSPADRAGVLDKGAWQRINPATALENADGDVELVATLVDVYFEQLPSLTTGIRDGLSHRKPEQVERNAHSLKGAISVFGGHGLRKAACDMEILGREGRWNDAEKLWPVLQQEIRATELELQRLCKQAVAGSIVV